MRKFLFVVLTSLAAMSVQAWEPSTDDSHPEGTFAQSPYAEALVTIAPVPMPGAVIELANYTPKAKSKQIKTLKAAKVAKSMLSRSVREQMALAAMPAKSDDHEQIDASDDENDDPGIEHQDLHRSFGQPKIAKKADQGVDDDKSAIDLPEHIKLRLLMARTKAVESHILSQAGKATSSADQDLPENVKLRLFMARARAVKVHTDKFGAA